MFSALPARAAKSGERVSPIDWSEAAATASKNASGNAGSAIAR